MLDLDGAQDRQTVSNSDSALCRALQLRGDLRAIVPLTAEAQIARFDARLRDRARIDGGLV